MQRLGGHGKQPHVTLLTGIALDKEIQLLIKTDRLRTLSLDEADAIGHAVTASLIDWMTAKGGK